MENALAPAERLVVYDGDCSLCTGAVRRLVGMGLIPVAAVRAFQSFDGDERPRLEAAGIRNELVVLDTRTGQARAGVAAILTVLAIPERLRRVLLMPPFSWLLVLAYRTFSYNRRVFAPPVHAPSSGRTVGCACDPDLHLGYRGLFMGSALILTVLFSRVVGSGIEFLIQVAAGWGVPVLAVLRVPAGRRADYLGHLALTMLVGSAILLPGALLTKLLGWSGPPDGAAAMAVFATSVAISFAVMVRMVVRRFGAIGLGARWVLLWLISMLLGAGVASGLLWMRAP